MYILSLTVNFIAFLGYMKKPVASCPQKRGIMSDKQNPHTGNNLMTAFFKRPPNDCIL